jgi:hypothetical protein
MNTLPPEPKRKSKVQRNVEAHNVYLTERRKDPSYVTATEILASPVNLTARGRRKLGKKRVIRYVSTVEPKSVHSAIGDKVESSSIAGLIRLMHKSNARAEKGCRVLEDLDKNSMFRANVEREINLNYLIHKAATAEYLRRTTAAPVKDARNPQHKRREALVSMVGGAQ